MARRTTYTPGTPNWVDLTTPDVEGAIAFYGAVFGWTAREAQSGGYWFFERDGAVVAGMGPLTDEQRERGMPPAWSMYVRVASVDDAVARAGELGGTVVFGPETIEEVGRLAGLADPQGGVVLLWEAGAFEGAEAVNGVDLWSWNDLQTPDPAAAAPFYAEPFGWEIAEVTASGGVYWSVAAGGRGIGGIMRAQGGVTQPYWTVYVGAADVDVALEKIGAAGGRALVEPMAVPAGRFAVAMDPQGAVICLVEGDYDD